MCGIVGLANRTISAEELSATCKKMTYSLAHRGPDDQGLWSSEASKIAFGHRRLSIQDLSQLGAQPMHSASGRLTITFNGEVYNFKSLRSDLGSYPFRGQSDTEVILAAIESWGVEETLKRLSGMFAFALFDREADTLTLARDRVGEKPLYYGWLDSNFFFSSELKVIKEVKTATPAINKQALTSLFRLGYIAAPLTIYDNIYKLPAAHFVTLSLSSWLDRDVSSINKNLTSYWSLATATKHRHNLSAQEAVTSLDNILHQTIRNQMISDVPIGSFLSGGIDSSLVSAIMQAESNQPIRTFIIGFDDSRYNEASHASAIAKHLGTNHTELYLSGDDFLNAVPSMATVYDEPFANGSQMATYLLSQLARQQVTVCLSGDGGDELFAGYNRYYGAKKVAAFNRNTPLSIRKLLAQSIHSISPISWDKVIYCLEKYILLRSTPNIAAGSKLHKLADTLALDTIEQIYLQLISYWRDPSSLLLDFQETPSPIDIGGQWLADFIEQAMYWDTLSYLPGDSLTKVDRASMAFGLETRLPLLDHNVIEHAWSLPLDYKFRNNQSKWLLRQVLYKYVPKELVERPKMGFSAPIDSWLRGSLKNWAGDLLATDRLEKQQIFNPLTVELIWNEHQSRRFNHGNKLWTLLMFQSWYDHWR